MNKRLIFALGWFTLLFFSSLGILFIYLWVNESVLKHLLGAAPFPFQLLSGLSFGIGAGLLAVYIINQPFLEETYSYYSNLIGSLELNKKEIFFLSICAGIGEEILFRAALQPLFGLWLVAVFFVAIHGYLNPLNWKLSVYGMYMVLVSAGFGYLFSNAGIIAASSAHFAFDVVVFLSNKHKQRE